MPSQNGCESALSRSKVRQGDLTGKLATHLQPQMSGFVAKKAGTPS
jgi:hypothetical protein